MFTKKGFSLVELMIVVAIIGILAAIAIPNFVEMQYRAKRSEAPGNVDGIKTAELSYDAAFDAFVAASAFPAGTPGKLPVAWSAGSAFDTIGWSPDGEVRGQYAVPAVTNTDFTVTGACDVDGNGSTADYSATSSINATLDVADANQY